MSHIVSLQHLHIRRNKLMVLCSCISSSAHFSCWREKNYPRRYDKFKRILVIILEKFFRVLTVHFFSPCYENTSTNLRRKMRSIHYPRNWVFMVKVLFQGKLFKLSLETIQWYYQMFWSAHPNVATIEKCQ